MARGNLPAQTPLVPDDTFVAVDELYRHVKELGKDVGYLEGLVRRTVLSKTSNTTLAADPLFRITLRPLQKIAISARLLATANIKYRTVGPASPALVLLSRKLVDSGGSSNVLDTAYSAADVVIANTGIAEVDGIIHNGATAGEFSINWAQNTSSATPSQFYVGSWLRYALID